MANHCTGCSKIFAVHRGASLPLLNTLVRGASVNSGLRNLAKNLQGGPKIHSMVWWKAYFDILNHLGTVTHECDRQTDILSNLAAAKNAALNYFAWPKIGWSLMVIAQVSSFVAYTDLFNVPCCWSWKGQHLQITTMFGLQLSRTEFGLSSARAHGTMSTDT